MYMTGYNIPSYFVKVFKNKYGVLPKDFMKRIIELCNPRKITCIIFERFRWGGIFLGGDRMLSLKHLFCAQRSCSRTGCFRFRLSILCGYWAFHLQDAFAFAKDPLCEEVLYPTISGTGKGACPFGFVRRSLKEKASFLFQTPSNKTVLRLCRRTPEIVVTRTGFKPVTF